MCFLRSNVWRPRPLFVMLLLISFLACSEKTEERPSPNDTQGTKGVTEPGAQVPGTKPSPTDKTGSDPAQKKWAEGIERDTRFRVKKRTCTSGAMGCRCSDAQDKWPEGCDPGGSCYWGTCYGPGFPRPETYRYTHEARMDYHVLKRLIINHLDLKAGMKVVDVGAGRGNYAFEMADIVGVDGVVYGTDIDAGAIKQLRQKQDQRDKLGVSAARVVPVFVDGPRVTGVQDVPDGEVDVILMINSLVFKKLYPDKQLQSKELDHLYLRDFLRVLKPGGRVLYHIDWFDGPNNLSAAEVDEYFSAAGFVSGSQEIPMPAHMPETTYFIAPATGKKVPLRRGYILVFRKKG